MEKLNLRLPSPLVELHDDVLTARQVRLLLKRDDLIHPDLTGNKWRKLKYNLEAARSEGVSTLLTFGGAYSNHIRAVAATSRYFNFKTIGVIRGEEHAPLNESLAYAKSHGMHITYMDRATYRQSGSSHVLEQLRAEFGEFYLIPEGGSNVLALRGCAELAEEIDVEFDIICCPCGTGGTLAGVASALNANQRAIGFSVLKGGSFLNGDVSSLQRAALGSVTKNWSIELGFHFGGYAKMDNELASFISSFNTQHGIILERVYVAKMMYGLLEMIKRGSFERGTVVIAVVTG